MKRTFVTPSALFAAAFSYLLVSVIILAFGPGRLSLDALLARRFSHSKTS